MTNNLSVSNNYLKFRTAYEKNENIVEGKCDFFKNGNNIHLSMFSYGVTNDGRKWVADDGYINIFQENGEKVKVDKIGIDKDNDGFDDTYLKVKNLQNGKLKEYKSKYNSEYVDKKLAEYMAIPDEEKRYKKLEKFKNKLLKAGISENAIERKFYPEKFATSAKMVNDNVTKKDIDLYTNDFYEKAKQDIKFSDMTTDEKIKKAINMVSEERDNKATARRLLMDKNLQQYYSKNPEILEFVASIAS